MNLIIKNATIADETGQWQGDVFIQNGKIAGIGQFKPEDAKVIDAAGYVLMPALIDMHCHFREPGFEHKETIETGSYAAAKGGYSYVNLMGNTNPVCSSLDVIQKIRKQAQKVDLVEIHQVCTVTQNYDGKTLDHLTQMDKQVKAISEDGKWVQSAKVMEQAMRVAKQNDWVVLSHEEDMEISPYDYRLAEDLATIRDITLAEYTGARLHISHLSTKGALQAVIAAKKRGVKVTCEVTPHYLFLWDNNYRVNPPIRTKVDANFLVEAIKAGWVDMIATDHAPHTLEDKQNGAPGLVGLETAFSLCYSGLVYSNTISLSRLSQLMSANPARLMRLNKGLIQPGMDADLILADLNKEWTIHSEDFASKGRNTPFEGWKVRGEILMTIKQGKVTYENKGWRNKI